jgi:hypothetical protein
VTRQVDDDVSVAEERGNDQSKTEVKMQWKLLLKTIKEHNLKTASLVTVQDG